MLNDIIDKFINYFTNVLLINHNLNFNQQT